MAIRVSMLVVCLLRVSDAGQQRQGEREKLSVRGRALEYALNGDGVDDAAGTQQSEH
jgi:hypothetical protein